MKFLLVVLFLFLTGCSSTDNEISSSSTSLSSSEETVVSSTTTESSTTIPEPVDLLVFQPRHNLGQNTYEILGVGTPGESLDFIFPDNSIEVVHISDDGKFSFTGDLPEESLKINVTNGIDNNNVVVKPKSTLESLDKHFESVLSDENKKEVESSEPVEVKPVETESSSESVTPDEKEILKPTEDQIDTLIVFSQMGAEDHGYKIKYRGKDSWNVAVNYIDGKNKWIITTEDPAHGRVKTIYLWDGKEDSGATLVYLLIGGEELVNRL